MAFIDVDIQDGFLRRRGWRGKWLTVYWHRYGGMRERSERFHCHPWRFAVSVVFGGWLDDELLIYSTEYCQQAESRMRGPLSVSFYGSRDRHRIAASRSGTRTLFLGFGRRQSAGENATEEFPEGFGHYTERSGKVGAREA